MSYCFWKAELPAGPSLRVHQGGSRVFPRGDLSSAHHILLRIADHVVSHLSWFVAKPYPLHYCRIRWVPCSYPRCVNHSQHTIRKSRAPTITLHQRQIWIWGLSNSLLTIPYSSHSRFRPVHELTKSLLHDFFSDRQSRSEITWITIPLSYRGLIPEQSVLVH